MRCDIHHIVILFCFTDKPFALAKLSLDLGGQTPVRSELFNLRHLGELAGLGIDAEFPRHLVKGLRLANTSRSALDGGVRRCFFRRGEIDRPLPWLRNR